ncbi:MAG: phage Gp37/Gp68 family protein [Turicibacter sp.]|nr:phage Gp37/Gp68 family protein [Turicibacter sp.]
MAQNTKIEWTDTTWNPITGCTKISDGCTNCYATKMANRLYKMGNAKYANNFTVTLHVDALKEPYKWKKPRRIFVCSMSDLFHEDVPDGFIQMVFAVMNENPQHTFQVLTKRPNRIIRLSTQIKLTWSDNIWLGTTVENMGAIIFYDRITMLKHTLAKTKFISFEPLLQDMGKLDLSGIDWAIVGGESGTNARPIQEDWVLNIKNDQNVAFYFKQWGGRNKKKAGRLLMGRTWDDMPTKRERYEYSTITWSELESMLKNHVLGGLQ